MTTAIIGVGNLGTPVARDLVGGGERVVLASRDVSNATALANELGELASAASVEEAIASGDVVVFAVWLETLKDLIAQHADLLRGKVVVDPSNPVGQDANGEVVRTLPDDQSSGSVVAGLLPAEAHFVKAFGTLGAESLAAEANRTPRAVLFYATDDDQAAEAIERLIRVAGFDAMKAGGSDATLRIETSGPLHQFGGLNGKVVDTSEARTALAAAA
ncbi:MAG: NADP oxidoreductase coenzyme F420-dependent [Actinobacteria bacterium]|nr:MAG: NADP oxidoreductase coenzyme F420-dependent [Actinomycetota bacterium]